MVSCKNCRALEFITSDIKHGTIMDIQLTKPRYNCVFGNKVVIVEGKPCCESCMDKTTRRKI